MNKERRMYALTAVLGIMIFILIYGSEVINPLYTDWLKDDLNDLGIHYIGWTGFRNSRWMFPAGCSDVLFYPNSSSVIFTDSIPCLAVLFKLLRGILPEEFQYFGIWGVSCFILQGFFGSKIIFRLTEDSFTSVMGGIFFMITPCFLWRMFVHTSLAGQWLLLAAIYLMIEEMRFGSTDRTLLYFIIMGALAASTHIYFIPICGLCLCAGAAVNLVRRTTVNKSRRDSMAGFIMETGAYLGASLATVFLLGGFTTHTSSASTENLGDFGFNLLGFINGRGLHFEWSYFGRELGTYNEGEYEGFAYLGTGFLFMAMISCCLAVSDIRKTKEIILRYKEAAVITAVLLILCIFIALGPTAAIGNHVLYRLSLPVQLEKLWSVFRGTGRFSWPVVYIIMTVTVVILAKFSDAKFVRAVLCIGMLIQLLDFHSVFIEKHEKFSDKEDYQDYVDENPDWENIFSKENGIEHVIFVPSVWHFDRKIGQPLAEAALENKKTLNTFYFAHFTAFGEVSEEIHASVSEGSGHNIYFYTDADTAREWGTDDMNFYELDGVIIGYFGSLRGLDEICLQKEDGGGGW